MKIQTVNQLISVFKDISTRHYQINGFGIGDNWENGASGAKMHPVLWINPTTATMPSTDNGYKTFEIDFEVRVFDLVNKDESNENEVLSDCIDILKDIITEFKGHPYYVNSQLNIIDDINFEAFTEEFDEEVTGWVCEISLMTPVLTSFCGIPSADITGFEFPGADCPDVNVLCPVFVEDVTGVYPIVVTTTGTTKEVSIVGGGLSDTFVISGEYDNGTLTLTRNDDVDVVVTGFDTGGDNDYTTSATLSGNIITFDRTDTVGAYSVDLTTAINSAPDKFVSSGAYDEINNKIVLTLNDASTVDIDTSAIGGGDSIYTADGTLTGDRTVDLDGNDLTLNNGVNGNFVINGSSNTTGNQVLTVQHKGSSSFLLKANGSIVNSNIVGDDVLSFTNESENSGIILNTSLAQIFSPQLLFRKSTSNANGVRMTTSSTSEETKWQRTSSANYVHQIKSGTTLNIVNFFRLGWSNSQGFLVGSGAKIGSEDISLQGSTLIKGNGTSTGSALAIYDNDTTPTKLWDFLDNGNVNLGGNSTIDLDGNSLDISSPASNSGQLDITNTEAQLRYKDSSDNTVNLLQLNTYDSIFIVKRKFEVRGLNNTTSFRPIDIEANTTHRLFMNTIQTSLGTTADNFDTNNSTTGIIRNGTLRLYASDTKTVLKSNTVILSSSNINNAIGSEDISLQGDTLLNANVNMPNLPTSATGLSSGDLWNDGGTLKIA